MGAAESAEADLPSLLSDALRTVTERLSGGLAEANHAELSLRQVLVLTQLEDHDSSLVELAARTGVSKQAMTKLVDRLEELGYLERIPAPNDRRSLRLRLTPRGSQVRALSQTINADLVDAVIDDLGHAEWRSAQRVLQTLAAPVDPDAPASSD